MLQISRRVALLWVFLLFSTSGTAFAETNPKAVNPFAKVPQKTCKDCKKCGPWCKCDCKKKCRCKPGCCKPPKKQARHQHPNHTPDPLKRHHPCPKCTKNKNKN